MDEITIVDDRGLTWRKASASQGNGNCVEVAFGDDGAVHVRDSKARHSAVLSFTEAEWGAFSAGMADGEFVRP